jgi:predicted nucleic acid-binding protein
MKECTLVDTNVLISANGRETHADLQCQLACIEALEKICSEKKVLLDSIGLIMDEYAGYCSYKGEPGVGDYFFKYVHDHQMVEKKCLIVQITQDKKKGFVEFPDHPDLVSFDPSDRKFVAVAMASGVNPVICNATDSDWEEHKAALRDVQISVVQLCPQHASR